MTGLRQGPQDLVENLERHADLINLPRIGSSDNFAFPNMQLNISPATAAGSGKRKARSYTMLCKYLIYVSATSLQSSLGFFGGHHIDGGDHEGTFTSMGVYSNLSEDCDPGYFFLLDIMVCLRLDPGITTFFCALCPHGGTGPIYTKGKPRQTDYRLIVVGYPVRDLIEGTGILPFAALPGNNDGTRMIRITPEMTPDA